MRAEELRLEAHDRGVARRQVRDRLDAGGALDLDREHERACSGAGGRVVVDVDEARLPGVLEGPGDLDHPCVAAAERRVDLDREDPLVLAEGAGELRFLSLLGDRDLHLALGEDERRARLALLLDRRGDRRDLGRGRPAAAADHAGAEVPCVRGELREVLRRRVRVDDAVAGHARETDVRHRGEREPVAVHLAQRGEGGLDAGAVIRADRGHAEVAEAFSGVSGGEPRERFCARVERQHCEHRQGGDAADGLDRRLELVELEEGLDGEEVDAAALEDGGLLGEDLLALVGLDRLVAEGADRAGDEHVAARDLPRLACQLDAGAVDVRELVLEVAGGELAAVGAERVRFDHVRPGLDEADVELDDGLGRAQVRLFGDADARHGAGDEDAHAPVRDERRAVGESLEEAVGHRRSLLPARGRVAGPALSEHRGHLHRSRR